MGMITRVDTYEGFPVHTFTWREKPAWLEAEIARILGYSAPSLDCDVNALHGEDYELVDGGDARLVQTACDIPEAEQQGGPVMVLYEPGLALVCTAVHGVGLGLRRLLVLEAAAGILEALGRDAFEREAEVVLREHELDLRAFKAESLLDVLEQARAHAPAGDEKIATCMAIVAEVALGRRVRLPAWPRSDELSMSPDALAERLHVPRTWAFHVLERVRAKTAKP